MILFHYGVLQYYQYIELVKFASVTVYWGTVTLLFILFWGCRNVLNNEKHCLSRSVVAQRVQVSRVGNPSHVTGDVQLQDASHPATLQSPAAESPAQLGCCATDQPEPATSVVM